jgi:RNA polymerase sigma factor (sigma-70 family)
VITDQQIPSEILQKIKEQDHQTLTVIYKEVFPMVSKYIYDNNGNGDDAKDIFQDAMYILIKKTADTDFQLTSKVSTYLFGISKNLWLKQLTKKRINQKEYAHEIEMEQIEEKDLDLLTKNKLMKKCIEALGEPCRTIIVQFYFLQTSMKEIAEMLHYTNANNAKNQKYKCFMRLKGMMLKDD